MRPPCSHPRTQMTDPARPLTPALSPERAGGYYLGGKKGFGVLLDTKPAWLHRVMMRGCFGWEWIDGPL